GSTIANSDRSPNSLDQTTKIVLHKTELIENDYKINFNLIDTPGFADYINNKYCWIPVCDYIDTQNRLYLFQESQPIREKMVDHRVHCCLYFISPTNKGLCDLDIKSMKEISKRVNLIPIISKADGFTKLELDNFKYEIRKTIKEFNIPLCQFIQDKELLREIKNELPYAVIGSQFNHDSNKRGRQYKWGYVSIDDDNNSDFYRISSLLIKDHMLDLILGTESYYEQYRSQLYNSKARKVVGFPVDDSVNIKTDGLEAFCKSSTVDYASIDRFFMEMNPIFVDKKQHLSKKFNEVIGVWEHNFREWKTALIKKQKMCNEDIQQVH
ncbi:Septin-domain-containing protein, partial [Ascoidea rubescens DSM 1968]